MFGSGLSLNLLPGERRTAYAASSSCQDPAPGITLPPGFCATVFADGIGHARHMAVAADGIVYVNTWSGSYYRKDTPREGGFLVALRDTRGTGHADVNVHFGPGVADGSAGGTGIALRNGWMYVEINDKIVRYHMTPGEMIPKGEGEAETIVSGLPITGEHPMHQFVFDAANNLLVNVGSLSNACEHKLGEPLSPGYDPCTELESRAGIWRFDPDKTGQIFSPAARWATGFRNGGGMQLDEAGRVWVTQHGRDRLSQSFKNLYKPEQGPELPAEELLIIEKGADYGWPTCYFDGFQKKLVLAPEYGGDGGSKVGPCATKTGPVAFFPAHWAPNDLLLYRGTMFPAIYRQGAFIAFHGSWNRAPSPQQGYRIVFQPLLNGKASGDFIIFANGFAGKTRPDSSAYRPSGLAMGPDGALYVSDDFHGRVWRIVYNGPRNNPRLASAPDPVYDDTPANAAKPSLSVPPNSSSEQVALGSRIFHGEVHGGTCSGCHGTNGIGGAFGSDLTQGTYLWSDGSVHGISETIRLGVTTPKQHTGAMPPLGGAQLSPADLEAISAYVWAIGHNKPSEGRTVK